MVHPLTESVPATWQASLAQQLDDLGRYLTGSFVATPRPGDTVIPATRLFESDCLCEAIADTWGSPAIADLNTDDPIDFGIAASRFARRIAQPLSAVALAGLAQGVGFDVSPERCTMVVGEHGHWRMSLEAADEEILRCTERPARWAVSGPAVQSLAELREQVWSTLYGRHLKPVFTRVLELGKVSEELLWTSAAEYAAMVGDSAEEYLTAEAARPFAADRHALFDAATLPGVPGPNPLRDTLDWVPVSGHAFFTHVQTRRMCCLSYLLEERNGRLCSNCPYLPLEARAAVVAEQHGVPIGTPAGPAARRAQEIGLQRPSLSRRAASRRSAARTPAGGPASEPGPTELDCD
jgi:ferric iron reductase protein FhuF